MAPALFFYLDTEPQTARCRECDIAAKRIIRDLITAVMSAITPAEPAQTFHNPRSFRAATATTSFPAAPPAKGLLYLMIIGCIMMTVACKISQAVNGATATCIQPACRGSSASRFRGR